MEGYTVRRKAARLLLLREILADWPECPSSLLAAVLGVNIRSIQRDITHLADVSSEIERLRTEISAERDPGWLTDEEVCREYGYAHGYLDTLAHRLPREARGKLGHRRLWSRQALDEYVHGLATERRGGRPRRAVAH